MLFFTLQTRITLRYRLQHSYLGKVSLTGALQWIFYTNGDITASAALGTGVSHLTRFSSTVPGSTSEGRFSVFADLIDDLRRFGALLL